MAIDRLYRRAGDSRIQRREKENNWACGPLNTEMIHRLPCAQEAVVGKEGEGFVSSLKVLDGEEGSRLQRWAWVLRKAHLRQPCIIPKSATSSNKPISSFQGISFKLADMATKIEAARLLTYRAAEIEKIKGLP